MNVLSRALAKLRRLGSTRHGELSDRLQRLRIAQTALCVKANLYAMERAKRDLAKALAAHDAAVARHNIATGPAPAPESPAYLVKTHDQAAPTAVSVRLVPRTGPHF